MATISERIVKAVAHANIALIKYWGKADEEKALPMMSSLSLTLDRLRSTTSIEPIDQAQDIFILNDTFQNTQAVSSFVDFFRQDNQAVKIVSHNNFPTAAGLASSASGYSALAVALNEFFKTRYNLKDLSKITRKGSGSACRSLYGGFVVWQKGTDETSFSYPLNVSMDIEMIIVIVDDQKKAMSSRQMMARTKKESRFYQAYVHQSELDLEEMKSAIIAKDIVQIGEIAQRNAMMMHATMLANDEPFTYFKPETIEVLSLIQDFKSQGLIAYYTMDAGPNVKIITTSKDRDTILLVLRQAGYSCFSSKAGKGAHLI